MEVQIRIPTPLRNLAAGKDNIVVAGDNLRECIADLEGKFPGFQDRLCDETGALRRFVNIYVNGEDVRFLDGLGTTLKPGDEVSIVPAVAGGA